MQGTRFRQVRAARSRNTLRPVCWFVLIVREIDVLMIGYPEGGPCPALYAREGRVTSLSPSRVLLQSSTWYLARVVFHKHTRLVREGYAYPCSDHVRVRPLVVHPRPTRGSGEHA